MDVSIILVNYNTQKMTSECIGSVRKHTEGISYEIILVDNASTDGSKKYFEKDKDLKYIYNEVNLGFGRANNKGIEIAKGDYIFLLNTDTILLNNACKLFMDYEIMNHDYYVLGAWLLDAVGQINHTYGRFPSKRTELSSALRVYTDRIPYVKKYNLFWTETFINDDIEVDYITGADLFIPRSVIEKVGMFDERFFMYYEESDLEKRMAYNGVKRRIIRSPKIIHYEQGSQTGNVNHKNMRKLAMSTTGMLIYIRKYSNYFSFYCFKILYFLLRLPAMMLSEYSYKEKIQYFQLFIK